MASPRRPSSGPGELAGGLAGSARAASGARVVPHSLGSILSGLTPSAIAAAITKSLVAGLFRSLLTWVAAGAASLVGVLANALSATTQPVLTGSAFSSEFELMAALSAAVALPLVALAAIQAIVRQEPGSLLRSVLIRLPLALLFTGVSVQLVALGLVATDQASALLIGADGDPTHQMLSGLITGLAQPGNFGLAAFGGFLVVGTAAVVAFVLWLELAVRSAAIAAAALFLPLALVGLAWPATSHWARRLGETLAALVLSKLVIAAVLALAAGLLVDPSGIAGVVEGVALLAIGAFAPFALLKLVPVIEAGAVGHLEGLGRRPLQAMERLGRDLGLEGGGVAALAGLGGILTRRSEGGGADPSAETTGQATEGSWTTSRPTYPASRDGAVAASGGGPAPLPSDASGSPAPSEGAVSSSPDAPVTEASVSPLVVGVTVSPQRATSLDASAMDFPVAGASGGSGGPIVPIPPSTAREGALGSSVSLGSSGPAELSRAGLQTEPKAPDHD